MKRVIFLVVGLFLFIGCNTSTNVSNNHPLEPKVTISNLEKHNDLFRGYIQINETSDFYSNVTFSNINLSSANCTITQFKPSKYNISNGEKLTFDANITCLKSPPTLKITFDETAQYMDTDIKTVKKRFSKEVEISSLDINASGNSNIKIANIQPSSVSINEGESFTFYVYTFDKNDFPISIPIKIGPPVDNKGNVVGEFDKYSLTTDEKGNGSFTYTAPTKIDSNEINLTIPVIFDNAVKKNLYINIKKNLEVIINPTKLILVPNSISIAPGATYNIKILTLDDNNRGISSKVTIAHPIDNNNNSWGSFDKYTLTTNENGEGSVIFTANNDISQLENNLSVNITVPSASLTANLLLIKPSSSKKETKSYEIQYAVPNSIQIEKDFNINIQVIDSTTGKLVNDSNITEINLTSENHLVYFDHNSSKYQITLKNMNNINIISTADKISGIDIIDVNATVDENGTSKTISKQIPIVIISGPVRAISINKVSSQYDSSTGLFVRTYSIHAVDKYSNPVNAGTKIIVGAVVNKKIFSNSGTLKPISESDKSEFDDNNKNFTDDLLNNTLIIFADSSHTDPLYLGGWIIDNVDNSHKLTLASAYSGSEVDNLSYVIGNEKRFISCSSSLAVADFDSADKTYTTNNSGIAIVKLRFDPDLIGKTIALFANSYQDKRVGISIEEVLLNNQILTKEYGEDEKKPDGSKISHNDKKWERSGSKDENTTGSITIGVNGGASSTDLGPNTTLAQNDLITLEVLTPSICTVNGNTIVNTSTNCNGIVSFDVNYSDDGTCKIKFDGFNYEY